MKNWKIDKVKPEMLCSKSTSCLLTSAMALSGFLWLTLPAHAAGDHGIATENVQQSHKITGHVVDETGEPMIGVTVKLKGTQSATVTDLDGNFVLNAATKGGQIELSYVGYKVKTVPVGNGNVSVKMEPDSQLMDEVVVIGYGTMKKRDVTGSISQVKSADITIAATSNPMEALQGKVAGLDITRESGQVGSGVTMQLRGNRSITSDASSTGPLFIIDGMPGDYSTLNPNDIESIEVLKDASSTAIYGAEGANGIVIITTKNGKEGKPMVNFNAYLGINGWAKTPKMRSGESYIQVLRDASVGANDGRWSSTADDANLFSNSNKLAAYQNGEFIDWADALLHTAVTQNYSLSVSGGTEKTKAYLSMNFSNDDGQYKQDSYKVYSSKMRIDHKVTSWLSAGIDAQLSYTHQNKSDANLDALLATNPLGTLYDEDGNINPQPIGLEGSTTYNQLLNDDSNVYKNQTKAIKVYFNPYIEVHPFKGFTFQSRIGAKLTDTRQGQFYGKGSVQWYKAEQNNEKGTYARDYDSRNWGYKWENILTYNFQIAKDHDFTVTGVTSYSHNQTEYLYTYQYGIDENKYKWMNIQDGDEATSGKSNYTMNKSMSYIGRVSYSYLGRYLASASIRYDGYSMLADGHKWTAFPAVSLGWRISDEKFMEGTRKWLDNLKLRVGYGETGQTSNIGAYSSLSSLDTNITRISLGGEAVGVNIFSQNIPNHTLSWEISKSINIGIDASFLNGRIDLSAEYYHTKTSDVIWSREIPVTNGAYTAGANYKTNLNICETSNNGFELTVNTRNIRKKDFTWNSTLTFQTDKERIKKLGDGSSDILNNGTTGYALAIGEAIKSYYHYKLDGIWQTNEATDAAAFGCTPGDIKINVPGMTKVSDGVFTKGETAEDGSTIYYNETNPYTYGGDDYQILGHNSPDWSLGFKNEFTYKGFDLSIFMYMRWGQMFTYDLLTSYDPQGNGNFPEYFNYWTASNPSNDFPAANAANELTSYTGYYALRYVDGSFFKIKNITLGYTLPKSILKKAGIEKLRIYGTITNPWVVAKSHLIKDYDPEQNGNMNYPLTKQLVFGVNLTL